MRWIAEIVALTSVGLFFVACIFWFICWLTGDELAAMGVTVLLFAPPLIFKLGNDLHKLD